MQAAEVPSAGRLPLTHFAVTATPSANELHVPFRNVAMLAALKKGASFHLFPKLGRNHMKESITISLATAALSLVVLTSTADAQQKSLKDQLVGAWTFVGSTGKKPDGSPMWGSNPKGVLIFTPDGHYSSHILREDIPKFKANNRLQGTADENKAAVEGGIATFGRYTVNEGDKSFTVRFEGSTYPNNTGVEQTRRFTIAGEELKVVNPVSSAGGQTELTYKRAK